MKNQKMQRHGNIQARVLYFAALAAVMNLFSLITIEKNATASTSTSNSWATKPSWAAQTPDENTSARSRRQSTASRDRDRESQSLLSPFSPGSNNLSLDVGQIFLFGDLGSTYGDSIGMQLHYTYGVSEMFSFDSSFGYSSHAEGKYSLSTLVSGVRMNLSWFDKVIPYINFGLGFYRPSYDLSPTQSLSPLVFGLHAGPGVNLELTKQMFFGASLTFHDLFGATKRLQDGATFEINGTYTAFLLSVGVTF